MPFGVSALPNRRWEGFRLTCDQSFTPQTGQSTESKMKAFLAMTVAACFLMLGGCNTMEGAGKDTQAAGTKIEKEAVEHKKY